MKYSAAILGSGSMGFKHTYGYDRINEYYKDIQIEKKIMCSRNVEWLKKRIKELGWNEGAYEWKEVVNRPDIDVIDISAQDIYHYEMAKEAIKSGKLIICEKPIASNAEQTKELANLLKEKNTRGTVCFIYRYMPAVQSIKRLIESGKIGEIRHIDIAFTMDWALNTSGAMQWRSDSEISPLGVLGDLGTHMIDLCRYLGMEFKAVCGFEEVYAKKRPTMSGEKETKANELCVFTARFNNNALGVFQLSRVSGGGGMKIEIHGTEGNIRWERKNANKIDLCEPGNYPKMTEYEPVNVNEIYKPTYPWNKDFDQMDAFTLLFHDFLTNNGKSPTFEDGYKAAKVVDAVLESAKRQATVVI